MYLRGQSLVSIKSNMLHQEGIMSLCEIKFLKINNICIALKTYSYQATNLQQLDIACMEVQLNWYSRGEMVYMPSHLIQQSVHLSCRNRILKSLTTQRPYVFHNQTSTMKTTYFCNHYVKIYSANEGNYTLWDEPTKQFVNECKDGTYGGKP